MRYCPPLQRYRIFKIVAALAAAAMIIVSSIVALAGISRAQAAGVLYKDLPEGAPKQGIVIDDKSKFYTIKPEFKCNNDNIVFHDIDPYGAQSYNIFYQGTTPSSGTIPSGEFSLYWEGIATDLSGDTVDMKIVVSNIRCYGYTNPSFISIYPNGTIAADAVSNNQPDPHGRVRNWFDIEYFFYKTGTDTPADGNLVLQYDDIDMYRDAGWSETVRLLVNYEPDLHIIPDDMKIEGRKKDVAGCWLDIQQIDKDPTFQAGKDGEDWNTLHSGFCVSAQNGYKFTWWGENCGTGINGIYGMKDIEAIAHTGGNITDEGTTSIAWKHDKIYTAQADEYHTISSVIVDGQEVDIPAGAKTFDYTFTEVIVDHKIEVSFVPIPASLSYDANLPSATGSTDGWTGDAGGEVKVAASGFVAEGYEFSHWNTEPDGTGTTYKPEDLITVKRQGEVLYAQWTPLDLSVKWIDTITGGTVADYSVKVGNDSPIPDIPSHREHDFTHLSGDRWNNITHDSIIYINYAAYAYDIPSYSSSSYNGFTFGEPEPIVLGLYFEEDQSLHFVRTYPVSAGQPYTVHDPEGNEKTMQITEVYTDIENNEEANKQWSSKKGVIKYVIVEDDIKPANIAAGSRYSGPGNWFSEMTQCEFFDLSRFDVSSMTAVFDLFYGCTAAKKIVVAGWDTSNFQQISSAFEKCTSLQEIVGIDKWDMSSMEYMSYTFAYCENLEQLDLSAWNVQKVRGMSNSFYKCLSLIGVGDLSSWDTSGLTNLSYCFYFCEKLQYLNLSGWDTSSLENLDSTFAICRSLTELDSIQHWDTSKVYTLSNTFNNCISITSMDLSRWNVSSVRLMNGTFSICSKMKKLDIANWDTSNVTFMSTTFMQCNALCDVDLSRWNTSNVTMFNQCFYLAQALPQDCGISNWDISSATNCCLMFYGCTSFTSPDFSQWRMSGNVNIDGMFEKCSKMLSINVTG